MLSVLLIIIFNNTFLLYKCDAVITYTHYYKYALFLLKLKKINDKQVKIQEVAIQINQRKFSSLRKIGYIVFEEKFWVLKNGTYEYSSEKGLIFKRIDNFM